MQTPMRFLLLFCLLTMLLECAGYARQNIIDFYPVADSTTRFPPFKNELSILGKKKISDRYVTFVGFRHSKKVIIAAVTLEPVTDIQKNLSLIPEFDGIRPNVGKIATWGYIFDRNLDGDIDYMALVGGAAAFKDSTFQENFPRGQEPLLTKQSEYYVNHTHLIFNHWADDNSDNTLDAVIHIDMDPDRTWVDRQLVIRSTRFDETFDDVFAFRKNIRSRHMEIPHTPESVPYHPVGRPVSAITSVEFRDKTLILRLINKAVHACGFTSKNFDLSPSQE